MNVKITYYLDIVSSWCHWAESAWAELKQQSADRPVEFNWKIALLDSSGLPASQAQEEWFYRRSGTVVRSPYMLNAGWVEPGLKEYLAVNAVAEAAKDFGVTDDRVRLALARAAMFEGQKVARWEECIAVAAAAARLDPVSLRKRAESPEVEARVRASTTEFHALQVTQRPTFLLENNIGDRVVFSGLVTLPPLAAALEALLKDAAAYASYAAHFGQAPTA